MVRLTDIQMLLIRRSGSIDNNPLRQPIHNTTTMRTITLLLALLLIGCSTERQCARAAKRCAHLWHSDTILTIDTVKIPGASTQLAFDCDTIHDTVKISEGNATLTLWRDSAGRMNADCNCGDTAIPYARQMVTNRIEQPRPWWYWWPVWVLGFIALRQFAVWVLRRP
jgi:hypothetical protein